MTEVLGLSLILCNFIFIFIAYKLFGKAGLFAYIALSVILVNIQVTKTVEVLGFVTSLGNAMFCGIMLSTDVLNEKYGRKEAQKGVWLGFFVMLVSTITMQLTLAITPHSSDFANEHLQAIFGVFPALLTVSFCSFLISQQLNVFLFNIIKQKLPSRKFLWLRNNSAAWISQAVDTLIFTFFMTTWFPWGIFTPETFWSIFGTAYAIKVFIALLDTPFIYLMTQKTTSLQEANITS